MQSYLSKFSLKFLKPLYLLILISVALTIFLQKSAYSQYQELYVPKIPDQISIHFDDRSFDQIQKDIKSISESKIGNIEKKYKKYYTVDVKFQEHGQPSSCKARARINGDWKDHIRIDEGLASLTVKLEGCYVGGVSKFRLLLPETKNSSNEIFWSMLMEEYGFPTLYTQFVNVRINKKTYKALFQEIPSTLFLERHGIREAPIIEYDEQQLWNARANWYHYANELNAPRHYSSSSPFGYWLDDESFSYNAPVTFGHLDNPEFASDELNSKIAMRALSQFIGAKEVLNGDFFYRLQSIWAAHGIGHNQKFIYLPVTNKFLPLYYDGMPNMSPNPLSASAYILNEKCEENILNPSATFQGEFTRRSGEQLAPEMKCTYQKIRKHFSHLNNWEISNSDSDITFGGNPAPIKKIEVPKDALASGFKNSYLDMLTLKKGQYMLCKTTESSEVCDPLTYKIGRKILISPPNKYIDEHKALATAIAGELDPDIDYKIRSIEGAGTYSIEVSPNQKYFLHIKKGNSRNIKIHLQGSGSRAVIYGELNDLDSVSIFGDAPNIYKDSRHDELMLTGCATFLNTAFNNPTLSSTATGCEDAINIMHSNGRIKNVIIRSATEDALDMDFSNLKIEQIEVLGAGNDCLDISTGSYEIEFANLKNCSDKAVSAGEYASISLDNVEVDGSTLGLVAKDGAILRAKNFKGYGIREKCIDAYVKKKRFPIGRVYVTSHNCATIRMP